MKWDVGLHRVNKLLLPMLSIIEVVNVWPRATEPRAASAPSEVDLIVQVKRLEEINSDRLQSPCYRETGTWDCTWVDWVYIQATGTLETAPIDAGVA